MQNTYGTVYNVTVIRNDMENFTEHVYRKVVHGNCACLYYILRLCLAVKEHNTDLEKYNNYKRTNFCKLMEKNSRICFERSQKLAYIIKK